jgi:hypothetical protein
MAGGKKLGDLQMAKKIETDEPKAPTIPQVGEVLRDLDGWTYGEDSFKNRFVDHDDECPCPACNDNLF